jgi:hypothetical protein
MHFLRGEMRDRIGIWQGIVPNIKAGVRSKMVQNIPEYRFMINLSFVYGNNVC